jgi:hypothetical protein
MKFLFALVATFAVSASMPVFADIPVPLSNGVECATVKADKAGQPDLADFNKQLNKRGAVKGPNMPELKSVSVSPLGDDFLVCTTAAKK